MYNSIHHKNISCVELFHKKEVSFLLWEPQGWKKLCFDSVKKKGNTFVKIQSETIGSIEEFHCAVDFSLPHWQIQDFSKFYLFFVTFEWKIVHLQSR